MAKMGSMPDEAPAMMLMVPVGAMVITVELRSGGPSRGMLPGQVGRGLGAPPLDRAHELVRQVQRLLAVVGKAQLHEQVGPAHDPQADAPVVLDGLVDLGQGGGVCRRPRRPGSAPWSARRGRGPPSRSPSGPAAGTGPR